MHCAGCGQEQEAAALLCLNCWYPLRHQAPCVAKTHFWHVREDDGWYTVFCFYCRRAVGVLPATPLAA